jgi:S1/P1 nuclease
MARTLIALLVAVPMTLAVMTPPAYGWGDVGHMMVAFVAYQDLTGTAKGRVNALVRRNPKFSEWQRMVPKGTSKADRNMMLFMIAATWADQIKGDPDYTSDGSHNGNRPEGSPDPTANRGYADKLMHKYWHFVDTPFSTDGAALPPVPTPNAQERIMLLRGVLASKAKDPLKSYDLVWLLHLVGDVHQPLHCVTRVSATDRDGDDGGNGVKVLCEGCPAVLHSFWDGAAGSGRGAEAIAPAIAGGKKLPKADPVAAAKSDVKDWIDESFELAKAKVYQSPVEAGSGPFMLTAEYQGMAKTLAEERIALAGARLASLLNKELK